MDFTSKVVLITGAASGFGARTAKAFAKHGSCLALLDINRDKLVNVAQECKSIGAKQVLNIVADLQKKEEIQRAMNETIDEYGRLDVLVNNAGIVHLKTYAEVKWDDFNPIFDIMVKAPLYLTQLAIPYLEKTKGNVVNVSSVMSSLQFTSTLLYCMAKSAVDQFTKTVALDVAKKGIRVNSVNPSFCKTDLGRRIGMSRQEFGKLAENIAKKSHPLGNVTLTTDEISDAILFLSSDSAKAVTGTCLPVDRGCLLQGFGAVDADETTTDD